jgi:hypothetical protein
VQTLDLQTDCKRAAFNRARRHLCRRLLLELAGIAQISEDAKARIGTTAEVSADRKTATLHERVTKALQ